MWRKESSTAAISDRAPKTKTYGAVMWEVLNSRTHLNVCKSFDAHPISSICRELHMIQMNSKKLFGKREIVMKRMERRKKGAEQRVMYVNEMLLRRDLSGYIRKTQVCSW